MYRGPLAILFVALVLANTSGATLAGDAGSGADAPGTRAEALAVDDGASSGAAHSPKDVDWFRGAPFADLRCVEARAIGSTRSDVRLEVGGQGFTSRLQETSETRFALAAAGATDVLLGFLPGANPAGHTPSRPGVYAFDLRRTPHAEIAQGDAGGSDAPSWSASAPPVGMGCFAGTLSSTRGDAADAYRFEGTAGRYLGLSFAHAADDVLYLSLLTSSGSRLALISGSGAAVVELPYTGAYTLAVTTTEDAHSVTNSFGTFVAPAAFASGPYVFALSDDPGNGCRPFCAE